MSSPVLLRCTAGEVELDGSHLVDDGTTLHLLDGSAARIWDLLDGTTTTNDVVAELAPDDPAAAADVAEFLDRLTGLGVVVADGPTVQVVHAAPPGVGRVRDGDHLVLAPFGTDERIALSPLASRVWELAVAGRGADETCAVLVDQLAVPPAAVHQALADLVSAALLLRVAAAPTADQPQG